MAEWMPYILGSMAALFTGVLVYVATRKRDTTDERAQLFDDALTLAEHHKAAWEDALEEVECLRKDLALLRDEVDDLRDGVARAIREGEMWRGVAVAGAQAEVRRTGAAPLWWPKTEPLPEAI